MHLTLLLLLLFFVNSKSYPYPQYGHEQGYGYGYGYGYRDDWYYPRYTNIKCFSADSYVKLLSGQQKIISSVRSGDQLMTIDQSKVISTDMIMMLDKHTSSEALFYTLITESRHNISLTQYHLIPIKSFNKSEKYVFAKEIQIGDLLYILENDTIEFSKVTDIIIEVKKGYYAPLTMDGTRGRNE